MSIRRSDILNKLAKNYPNFIRRDLNRLIDIFISEIKNALKRRDRVELREFFSLEPKHYKPKFARNPRTNEKIYIAEKYGLLFKSSKTWTNKINEKK